MPKFLLLLLLLFSFSVKAQIELTSSRDRNNQSVPAKEYFFDVAVNGIDTRKVQVTGYLPENDSIKGTIIVAAGGTGKSYWAATYGQEAKDIIDSFYHHGYAVYDLKYADENGWSEHCEGIGSYHQAVEIYAEMVRHLHANNFKNKDLVFATGNSGGSFQIAFGLALFNLEDILDMVVLTGGPPIADLRNGIFGDVKARQYWPNGLVGGLRLTDYLMGWSEEQHCQNRNDPDSILNAIDTVSLVSSVSSRDYSYSTMVNFVQSDDPTNAHEQAEIYYDVIQSEKAWHYLDSVDIHAVPGHAAGAAKIKELILGYTPKSTVSVKHNEFPQIKVYPNPVSTEFTIEAKDIGEIEIYDAQGKKVYEYNSPQLQQQATLDIKKLQRGTYSVKVYCQRQVMSKVLLVE